MDWITYTSAGVSGFVTGLAFHPLDSLYYNYIVNGKRPTSLFKGLTYNISTNIIKVCGIFPTQKYLNQKLNWIDNQHMQDSVSGILTGLVMSMISTPINAIKVPLLTNADRVRTVYKHIYRERGFRGFSRGVSFAVLRDGAGYGTYFTMFPVLNSVINNTPISSVLAAVLALCFAYPLDIARTLRQNRKNHSFRECMRIAFTFSDKHKHNNPPTSQYNRTAFYIYMIRMLFSIPAGHCTYLWAEKLITDNSM